MAGPGEEIAGAGDDGRLRASHADRELVVGALKGAFVQGRLDRDESDARIGQALASRTRAELAALIADIPSGMAGAQPPEPAGDPVNKKAVAALACATAALVGAWQARMMIPDGLAAPAIMVFALWLAGVLMGWPLLFFIWLDRRAGRLPRQGLPPGRARGGPVLESERDDGPGGDLTLCQARSEAGARHRPGPEGARPPPGRVQGGGRIPRPGLVLVAPTGRTGVPVLGAGGA